MANLYHMRTSTEKLRRAQSDGELRRLRQAVHCGESAVQTCDVWRGAGGKAGRELAEELRQAGSALEIGERCSSECRSHLSSAADDVSMRRTLQTAARLDLGPRLWVDPSLCEVREHFRAHRRLFQAAPIVAGGEVGHRGQDERRAELWQWIEGQNLVLANSCGTANYGPGAPDKCTSCGGGHFWFCHGCCCVQFDEHTGLTCMHGCNRRRVGWTCIGSECEGLSCGCHAGAAHWRQWGSVRTYTPPEPPPPPEAPDGLPDLKSLRWRQLVKLCEAQGEYRWRVMADPTPKLLRHLVGLCKEEGLPTTGGMECILQRLNWQKHTVRGEPDGVLMHDTEGICVF
jgi:hypothetical protein